MKPETRILLAVPTAGSVDARTSAVVSLLNERADVDVIFPVGRPTDYVRNAAVRLFLANRDYTHLFFLDSDTEPPLDALDRLLTLDAPLAVGCYACAMRNGLRWSLARRDDDGKYRLLERRPSTTEPFAVDAAGAGILLIRRHALEAMTWPWFKWAESADGSQQSEDIYFYDKANAFGYTTVCDPTVLCRHQKTVDLTALLLLIEQRNNQKPGTRNKELNHVD